MVQEIESTRPIPDETLSQLRDACEGMDPDIVWLDSRESLRKKPSGDQVSQLLAHAEARGGDLPVVGLMHYAAGMKAAFELDVDGPAGDGAQIVRVSFRVSPCVALVAYSEWLASRVTGLTIAQAFCVESRDVVEGVPSIPRPWHLRAELAILALRSALLAATPTSS